MVALKATFKKRRYMKYQRQLCTKSFIGIFEQCDVEFHNIIVFVYDCFLYN